MDKQQAAREAFERIPTRKKNAIQRIIWIIDKASRERDIKQYGVPLDEEWREGLYADILAEWQAAQATNYTYTGEQDRRKSQHIYKRHLSDANFEYWYNKNCTVDLDLTSAKIGWEASREALMPALVEARDALESVLGAAVFDRPEIHRRIGNEALARINLIIGDKK